MKHIILGTAGHIDHGKTALVKALTGTDTDRLKEEKERGITIELGFAHLKLPNGQELGIIDVPGHERFVRQMVAGASGIDIVALVIAADEGVMPQTREHLEICQLLGIKSGVVVLTKKDMVDEEWLQLVREDVVNFLEGTFLKGAPVIAVSSLNGEGLPELLESLEELAEMVPEKSIRGPFRLPIDRVFTIKGFGTVVTGTAVSGTISVGESVTIYPYDIISKIRGIQVHNRDVRQVAAGSRTAINLQGIEKEIIERGSVIATADSLEKSYLLDVSFSYLSSLARPLKNGARLRFHTGTCEVPARITLLDRDELKPGEKTFAQLRLLRKIAVLPKDRYVLRSYSPVLTVGGGEILHPVPKRRKRFVFAVLEGLKALESGSPEEVLLFHAGEAEFKGLARKSLAMLSGLTEKEFSSTLHHLIKSGRLVNFHEDTQSLVRSDMLDAAFDKVLSAVKKYHESSPLLSGMPKEELRSRLSSAMDPRLFAFIIGKLVEARKIVAEKELIRLAGHKVALKVDDQELRNKIEKLYIQAGFEPPSKRSVLESLGVSQAEKLFDLLVREGTLVKIKDDLFYYKDHIAGLKERVIAFLEKNKELSPAQFKELTGLSRKYAIPLLEYLDNLKITIRVGDKRLLR